MARPLKVLINAQMTPGGLAGGTEQFLMGLVSALGRLTDGEEQYTLITSSESPDWLKPFMGPNQRIVAAPPSRANKPKLLDRAKVLLGPLREPAGDLLHRVRRLFWGGPGARYTATLPQSDGFIESLGGDVIHFPYQTYTCCRLPSVYNPWDLQHVHYPHFFSKADVALREILLGAACRCAQAIAAPSWAVKSDLEQHYGLDGQKIFVAYCAPPAALYEDIPNTALRPLREKFRLPDVFAFFPAQTWPHKNHLRLLEAVRQIRDSHGVKLNLVCSGTKNEHWPVIRRRINELDFQTQVVFLGFVSPLELRSLYHLAQFVVFPSLFEGAGLPVIEAFQERVAVTCSDIPPLREYGDDAVLTFDPLSVESIAASLLRISSDEALREQLRARGLERTRLFTWERTGKSHRALYRKVAGVSLTEEDLHLLTSNNGR